mgnify:CR=1 FL=1
MSISLSSIVRYASVTGVMLIGCNPAMAGFSLFADRIYAFAERNSTGAIEPASRFQTDGFYNFDRYVRDSATDPIIPEAEIQYYRFELRGHALAVEGSNIVYSGTYQIIYSIGHVGFPISVSDGVFVLRAFFTDTMNATMAGELFQMEGPEDQAFFDLSYGSNSPLTISAQYHESVTEPGGALLNVVIRQNVPGVGTFGAFAAAALAMGRRRRR